MREQDHRETLPGPNRLGRAWRRRTFGVFRLPRFYSGAPDVWSQAAIKIARRNINNLRYADDTTLMAESED